MAFPVAVSAKSSSRVAEVCDDVYQAGCYI